MKLYSHPLSPNCRKVHTLIHHLGMDVEQQTVDLMKGEQKQPDFLAINPMGKVPALVDGKTKLSESNVIMAYLCAKQDTNLWPKSNARYDILKWLNWEAAHLSQAVGTIIGEKVFKPMRGAEPDAAVVDKAMEDFRQLAAVANGQLETTKHLAGDGLTIADIGVGVWLGYTEALGLPVAEFTHVHRWYQDLTKLPAWQHAAPPQM